MHRPLSDTLPHHPPAHLAAERLAALADDELTTGEAGHICTCDVCARELNAQRDLRALARDEAARLEAPLTRWETLAPRLREAGLIRAASSGSTAFRWARRAAAAVVLVAGGVLAGRLSARIQQPGAQVVAIDSAAPAAAQASSPASLPELHDSVPIFHSPAEALATLSHAEQEYRHAAAYLVASDPSAPSSDRREMYRARLAALDEVAQTTRSALEDAPHDPVLNQYYMSSVNAREATLRQLGGALPVGMRLDRY
jgi:hypothetical protein